MQRVSVVGCSASGKTTVARRLAESLGVPHIELDALHWGPEWTEATREQLCTRILPQISRDAWVVDGNYQGKLGTLVWERADTVVWVDPPRWRVMWQSFTRTVRRAATRQELWNGNRERWGGLMFWRGEESIVRWAWISYDRCRRFEEIMGDPRYADLTFHRLRHRRDVARLLDSLAGD